jgi:hypothetical protein
MGAQEVLVEGARRYLEPGEELLAACLGNPRGYGQMTGSAGNPIAREIAARKVRKSRAAAEGAGLTVDTPMALALTSRRLLTMGAELSKLGKVAAIGELLGAVPRESVEAIEVKRFGLGRRITVKLNGREAPLEGDGDAPGLAEAFAAGPAAAAV